MLSIPYAAGEALTIKNTKEKVVQMVSPSLSPWAPPCPLCKIPAYLYLMWLLSRCWCDTKSKHPEQSCCGRRSTLLSWIISQHRMRLSSALKPCTLGLRKHVLTFCIRSLITSASPAGVERVERDYAGRQPRLPVCRAPLQLRMHSWLTVGSAVYAEKRFSATRQVGKRLKARVPRRTW